MLASLARLIRLQLNPGVLPLSMVRFDDPEHSTTEERFALLGLSARVRMLVVIHCYREGDDVVRLISARKATRNERAVYDAQEL